MAALGSSAPLVCSSLWTAGSNVYAEEVIPLLPELEGVPGDIVCVLFSIYQVIMQDANEQPNEEARFMGAANLSAQVRP